MRKSLFITAFSVACLTLIGLVPSVQAQLIYVVSPGWGSTQVFDTETGQVIGGQIPANASGPIALTPDGRFAVASGGEDKDVSIIETATRAVSVIGFQYEPHGVAISPDGKTAYVVSGDLLVPSSCVLTRIDIAGKQVIGQPINLGHGPSGVAVAPDGKTVYVSYRQGVLVIDTNAGSITGQIPVGESAMSPALTPNGKLLLVANSESNSISIIDTKTKQVLGSPGVGDGPIALAISPDGKFAYVADHYGRAISVIDIDARQVVGEIALSQPPRSLVVSPSGRQLYVTAERSISVIDIAKGQTVRSLSPDGSPQGVAGMPAQSPTAEFSWSVLRPRLPGIFVGSGVSEPRIAAYDWSFGDGRSASSAGPKLKHVFARPGVFSVTLTVTSNEGCSNALIFTGQTAYCNGTSQASKTRRVRVAFPSIRVKCPAKGRGFCRFRLRAVGFTNGRRRAQSTIVHVRVRKGDSGILAIKPKPSFEQKLAVAKRMYIVGTVWQGGKRRNISRWFRVIR